MHIGKLQTIHMYIINIYIITFVYSFIEERVLLWYVCIQRDNCYRKALYMRCGSGVRLDDIILCKPLKRIYCFDNSFTV